MWRWRVVVKENFPNGQNLFRLSGVNWQKYISTAFWGKLLTVWLDGQGFGRNRIVRWVTRSLWERSTWSWHTEKIFVSLWIPKKVIFLRRLLIIRMTKWSTLRMSVFHQPPQSLHNRPRNELLQRQWWRLGMISATWTYLYLPGYCYWWVSNLPVVNTTEPLIWQHSLGEPVSHLTGYWLHGFLLSWRRQNFILTGIDNILQMHLPSLPYASASTSIPVLTDYPKQYCGIPYSVATSQGFISQQRKCLGHNLVKWQYFFLSLKGS